MDNDNGQRQQQQQNFNYNVNSDGMSQIRSKPKIYLCTTILMCLVNTLFTVYHMVKYIHINVKKVQ